MYPRRMIEQFRAQLNNTLFLSEEHNYPLLENIIKVDIGRFHPFTGHEGP